MKKWDLSQLVSTIFAYIHLVLAVLTGILRYVGPIAGVVCFFLDIPIVVYICGGLSAIMFAFSAIVTHGTGQDLVTFMLLLVLPTVVSIIFKSSWFQLFTLVLFCLYGVKKE